MLLLIWIRFLRIVLQRLLNFVRASVRLIVIFKKDFEKNNRDIDLNLLLLSKWPNIKLWNHLSSQMIKKLYYTTDINIFTDKAVCIDKVHQEIKNPGVFATIFNFLHQSYLKWLSILAFNISADILSQPAITSKLTIETLEQGVKYVQS